MERNTARQTEALGQSEQFLDFQEKLSLVAPVDRPVLLLGERGTGKELAATRLHFLSHRWQAPFVTLNCAMLSPTLIEAELFGYEKGAFTGADSRRSGRFEAAHGGTLFLDEVGAIPLTAQEKILRVVEYGVFERVGSATPLEVDVRIICATNVDLAAMAQREEFKQDLLDRLSFEVLHLPPLRFRQEDILLLASHFGGRMAYELQYEETPRFSDAATKALLHYHWPGNVRELINVVERAVYRARSAFIDDIRFDPFISPYAEHANSQKISSPEIAASPQQQTRPANIGPLKEAVAKLEVEYLQEALRRSRYNQKKAATLLGLSYDQFRGIMRKHKEELE